MATAPGVANFTNTPQTTVTAGGSTAPASGTQETWTVASSATFPAASSTAFPPTWFHIADPANIGELIRVTNVSGTTWTVIRGDEGTTPVSHSSGFTIRQVVSAGTLTRMFPAGPYDWINVVNYGADNTGATDSTTAIQAALNSALAGHVVYVPPGTYTISSPLSVPSGVALRGARGGIITEYGSTLKCAAGFSGVGLITFPASSSGQEVSCLCLDGSAMPSNTAHGIAPPASAPLEVHLRELLIIGAGFANGVSNIQGATSWRAERVSCISVSGNGFGIGNAPDSTWIDCYSLSAVLDGWNIAGASNSHFTNCRGEWSGNANWHLTGAWPTGTASGGCTITGCSSDRATQNGMLIDATGTVPVIITNFMARRDGRNGGTGGGGFSGVSIAAATIPVIIGTLSVFPGVDDNGSGTNSPQIGLSVSGSSVLASVGSGWIQGATTAISDTHTGGIWGYGPGVTTATGTTSAPASITGGVQAGTFTFNASSVTFNGGNLFAQDSVDIFTAGQGLKVAEGSNAKQGTVTMNGTTAVVVSNTSVTANSRIFLTIQSPGGVTPGTPYVSARVAGTSFSVKSTVASDNSIVAYEIIEPG